MAVLTQTACKHQIIFRHFLEQVYAIKPTLYDKSQISFHPLKFSKSIRKHHCEDVLGQIFGQWPPSVANPFVLPAVLYGCFQANESLFHTRELVEIAQFQCLEMQIPCPIVISAILLAKTSEERVRAVEKLIVLGANQDALCISSNIDHLKCTAPAVRDVITIFEGVSPLIVAVAVNDYQLIHTLLKLHANPLLVCSI